MRMSSPNSLDGSMRWRSLQDLELRGLMRKGFDGSSSIEKGIMVLESTPNKWYSQQEVQRRPPKAAS
ncbi:hypothetical protein TNCV_3411221 [Trichonephila clavipes]|nr:hypothetical protein TNCV_3411221 [Trichonephila clavipes]